MKNYLIKRRGVRKGKRKLRKGGEVCGMRIYDILVCENAV
jgi:hypothetical protein